MTPHIFNEKFERVITLTSDATKDRIPYIKRIYKENNIKSEFYFSVDPKILKEHRITPGGISCTSGHYGIISTAIIDEVDSILILEDDVVLCDNHLQLLDEFFKELGEWEILQLGYNYTKSLNWQYTPLFNGYQNESIVSVPYLTYGSHCFGITKFVFEYWAKALKNNIHHIASTPHHKKDDMYGSPFVQQADHVLSSMYGDFKSYIPTKNIIGALSNHKNDKEYFSEHDMEFASIVS